MNTNRPYFSAVNYKLIRQRARSKRKSNFNEKETKILVEEFMKYRPILLTRINNDRVRHAKAKRWRLITESVNSVSKTGRSDHELKKKWNNLFTEARSRANKILQAKANGIEITEDGDIKELTELDKKVLEANDRKELGDIDHDEALLSLQDDEMETTQPFQDPFVSLYSNAPEEETTETPEPNAIKVEPVEEDPVPVKLTMSRPAQQRNTDIFNIAPKTGHITATISTPATANNHTPYRGPAPGMLQQPNPHVPQIASVSSISQGFNDLLNPSVLSSTANSINDLRQDLRALVEVERERLAVERERLEVEKSRLELQEELVKLKWEKYSGPRKQNHTNSETL